MTHDRRIWIVDDEPGGAVAALAPTRTVIGEIPTDAGWDLADRDWVWPVSVGSTAECAAVVGAVLRGVAVVVTVRSELGASEAARLVDDLHRAADTVPATRPTPLTEDEGDLLDALSHGATVRSAAASLGMSTRTAARRLAEAHRKLNGVSTAEALLSYTTRR